MTKRAKPARAWAAFNPKGALVGIATIRQTAIEEARWGVSYGALPSWAALCERGYRVARVCITELD